MENVKLFIKNWFDDAHDVGGLGSMKQFMKMRLVKLDFSSWRKVGIGFQFIIFGLDYV
jgi:hypothetical protein